MVTDRPVWGPIKDVDAVEHRACLCLDAGFLKQLANGGLRDRLAKVDLAAGKAPQADLGRVGATDQQDGSIPDLGGNRGRHSSAKG